MSRRTRGVAPIVASLIAAASPIQAAPVLFDDGLLHTIPGDPDFVDGSDWILLDNGSALRVNDFVQVRPQTISSNVDAVGDAAITTAAGTTVRIVAHQNSAMITGGPAEATSDVGTPPGGLSTSGGAGLDIGGALEVVTGFLTGGDASSIGDPSLDRTEAFAGVGVSMRSGSATIATVASIVGGLGTAEGSAADNLAVGGDAFLLSSGAPVIILQGSVAGGVGRCQNGLNVAGNCVARGGHGLNLLEQSIAVVYAGTPPAAVEVTGGSASAESGFVLGDATAIPGSAVRADDGAHLAIYAGLFTVGTAAVGTSGSANFPPVSALRLDVTGSPSRTHITILGGVFRGDHALEIPFTSNAASDAGVLIAGGDLDSAGTVDLRLAHPGVSTRIMGTAIALNGIPTTGLVLATTGTLSGTLLSGQGFSWTFERLNGAPLRLDVPEPSAGLVPALLALATCARRRSKAHPSRL